MSIFIYAGAFTETHTRIRRSVQNDYYGLLSIERTCAHILIFLNTRALTP